MITIENRNKDIYMFGRKDKKPYTKKITSFHPYFYAKDKEGFFRGIDGTKLKQVICKSPHELAKTRMHYGYKRGDVYEGDVLYTNRYIIDKIETIEKEDFRVCYLDIEITKTGSEYSTPEKANNPIVSIVCYDSFDKEYITFYKGTETHLLKQFIKYIQDKDPDILTAWYGDGFDFPYIINRLRKIGISPYKLSRLNGPAYQTKYGARIFGRILIDLLHAYKKHFSQGGRESWSLEYISKYELGDSGGKEKYNGSLDKLYKTDITKFLKYNRRDVELLVMLDEKLGIINFFDEMRRIAHCRFEDIFMNSKMADCLCLKYAKEHNFILPSVTKHKKSTYKGGYVQDSIPDLHKNVGVFDMKSLYPSIMIGFNMSYETLSPDGKINLDDKFKFKKEKGIIPSIVKPLLDRRAKEKQKLKKAKQEYGFDSKEFKKIWRRQFAFKVIANSFYGVLGFRTFRLFKKEVAEAITYAARMIIKEVALQFEKMGYKTIYGDTDSCFIKFEFNDIDELNNLNEKINNYFTSYFAKFGVGEESNIFKLEFEKFYRTVFFKKAASGKGIKKKYAGRLYWKDGKYIDDIDIVGFESKRSDSPQIGRDFLKNILKQIVFEKQKEEIDKIVKQFRNEIKEGKYSPEKLGLPMGLTKHPNNYGNQIHARASRVANKKHNAGIKGGDKIKYIYTKDKDGVIAFIDKCWKGYHIDYDKMIRRIIDLKIYPLYESLGWKYPFTLISTRRRKKHQKDTAKQLNLMDCL